MWFEPGSTIESDVCSTVVCDMNGQVYYLDNFNCKSSTTTPAEVSADNFPPILPA